MVTTVVREHHWSPTEINGLYLDDIDHFGLIYWYEDIKSMIADLKNKQKPS